MPGVRLTKVLQWQRGVSALATGVAPEGPVGRALTALDAMDQLGGLLAATADPQAERARRLAPTARSSPVALLASARSLRFYLPIEPGQPFEVEATIVPDEGELALVQIEARRPNGERAARGELRFLIVPATGEHRKDGQARDALQKVLGPTAW
jgi:3-hydroxymyristoyl/3-hydroxydecanoyl-(acyl carrier protein) dehydratase